MKILVFLLFFIISAAYSQQNEFAKYYPLNVGNVWVYSYYYTNGGFTGRLKRTINVSYIFNNHKYFRCGWNNEIIRVDSNSANVMIFDSSGFCPWSHYERVKDSLNAKLNNRLSLLCLNDTGNCLDTNIRNVFGLNRRTKHFLTNMFGNGVGRVYAENIGVTETYGNLTGWPYGFYSESLLGCVINGVLFGDTSLTGIKELSSEVPGSFSLLQNYPNPFNPNTIIKFSIPGSVGVAYMRPLQLKIYDVLGREIATLVNQQMQPGSYSVDWDGTNYPSGVYFYRLIVGDNSNNGGDFTQTKKMLLIK